MYCTYRKDANWMLNQYSTEIITYCTVLYGIQVQHFEFLNVEFSNNVSYAYGCISSVPLFMIDFPFLRLGLAR
jgi:hypothetical protein